MGLLFGEKKKTLTYNESKPYQKTVTKAAALQLTRIFQKHWKLQLSEAKRLLHGSEEELHLIKTHILEDNSNDPETPKPVEYSVFLGQEAFVEQLSEYYHSRLDFSVEFSGWMLEVMPKIPFSGLIGSKAVREHFDWMTKICNETTHMKSPTDPTSLFPIQILSCASMPKVGYENYLGVSKSSKVKKLELSKGNERWGSKFFIDETMTKHTRYTTFTNSYKSRRGRNPEINIPLFIDKKTQVRYGGLYRHYEDYEDRGYSMKEKMIQELDSDSELKKVKLYFERTNILIVELKFRRSFNIQILDLKIKKYISITPL